MIRYALIAVSFCAALSAATLEKLTLDDMIAKSTSIVRGKVTASRSEFRGPAARNGMIYTHYTLSVSEWLKGAGSTQASVAVPGGTAQGYRQVFAGAPQIKAGEEFVFFLWTSRSGLTQVIGLTQGLLTLGVDASGKPTVSRGASNEPMMDPRTGKPTEDSGLSLSYAELKARVASVLGRVQ